MTLQQLATIKQWHLSLPPGHPVQQQVWDAMLASWVSCGSGLPAAGGLHSLTVATLCLLLLQLPGLYLWLRRRLHQRGRLRCEGLSSAPARRR
jgi:hypothetical protein